VMSSIGTTRTFRDVRCMSVMEGTPDIQPAAAAIVAGTFLVRLDLLTRERLP